MMILFLIGTLLALLTVIYIHIQWVRKDGSKHITRFVKTWSIFCIVILLCRFGLPFYRVEQEVLRIIILLLSAIALIWLVLFSLAGVLVYCVKRFAHRTVSIKSVLLLVMACSFVVTAVGSIQALRMQNTTYDIVLEKKLKQDVKMAMISDLHLGSGFQYQQIEELFKRMKKQDVDVLVISGDLFDEATPQSLIKYFCEQSAKLNLRDGMYYVNGNHELLQQNQELYETMLKTSGYQVLKDEYVSINDSYYIVGRLDKKQERKEFTQIIENINVAKPLIVLDHRPDFDDAGKGVIDLQLSGHTHHGQIFPNTLLTKIAYPYDYGLYEEPYRMIVSSGAGTWGIPIRLGSVGEIVYLNITS